MASTNLEPAAGTLHGVGVRAIVRAIADAAARWSDADFPPRVRILDRIVERTGYSVPVVEYALDALFGSITHAALIDTVEAELGSLEALDRFVHRNNHEVRAHPLGSACIISSRTTIGVAVVPAIFALVAKNDVVVKDREDALTAAFFETLAQEREEFSRAACALQWAGVSAEHDLRAYDTVVAFGRDETLAEIRSRCRSDAHFIGYGAKASIGFIGRDALNEPMLMRRILDGAARDCSLYDSEGCLSLHALFVERGAIEPRAFGVLLAEAMERAAVEFPVGRREAARSAALLNARNLGSFRAAAGRGAVFSDEACSFVLIVEPPADEPPPFLPRALAVHFVDGPQDVIPYLERFGLAVEALAASNARATESLAAAIGAARVAPFGELQRPPLWVPHGGRPRIAEFLHWTSRQA